MSFEFFNSQTLNSWLTEAIISFHTNLWPILGKLPKNLRDKGRQNWARPTNHEVVWDHSSSSGVGQGQKQWSDGANETGQHPFDETGQEQ